MFLLEKEQNGSRSHVVHPSFDKAVEAAREFIGDSPDNKPYEKLFSTHEGYYGQRFNGFTMRKANVKPVEIAQ